MVQSGAKPTEHLPLDILLQLFQRLVDLTFMITPNLGLHRLNALHYFQQIIQKQSRVSRSQFSGGMAGFQIQFTQKIELGKTRRHSRG
jgi:hypothetical protein